MKGMSQPISPTGVQQEKFELFMAHELKTPSIEFLNQIVDVANLSQSDLGTDWGVTLCPDVAAVLRINIGNWEFARVGKHSGIGSSAAMMAITGKPTWTIGLPSSFIWQKGFESIENDVFLWTALGNHSTKTLSKKRIQVALKAAAVARRRTLLNSNYHNPLSEQILDFKSK